MTGSGEWREDGRTPWDGEDFDSAAWAAQRAAERERRRAAERARRRVRATLGVAVLVVLLAVVTGVVFAAVSPDEAGYSLDDGGSGGDLAAVSTPTPAADAGESGVAEGGAAGEDSAGDGSDAPEPVREPEPASPRAGVDPVAAAAVSYPGAPAVEPRVIHTGEPAEKLVAITIDDGIPIDERLLDLLIERDVRVTTFVLGQAVTSRGPLIKRMHEAGFEIASHGWDHASFSKMSESQMRQQLKRTQDAISEITGDQAPYFRPPYGARNDTVDRVAAELGYNVVMWDASFVDTYKNATPEYCMDKALKTLHPGSIILCHWGRPATYGAMKLLLDELDSRGYRVVTVSELLAAPTSEMR